MDLQELFDREEIRQLRSKYSHYFDSGDLDALANLFTEDAVCEYAPEFGGHWVGREAIRANYARYIQVPPQNMMHAITNEWVVLTGPDSAEGRWFLLDLDNSPGRENPFALIGVYDDAYRRVDGSWKFHRTRIDILWPTRNYVGGVPGRRVTAEGA